MSCRLAVACADQQFIEVLLETIAAKKLAISTFTLLAADPYEVDAVRFEKRMVQPKALADFDYSSVDILIVGGEKKLAAEAIKAASTAGIYVVDCSLNHADNADAVFIVPEVNPQQLQGLQPGAVVANPSPASIFLSLVIRPLLEQYAILDVTATCLMPAANRGKAGVAELVDQAVKLLNGLKVESSHFPQQLAFNIHGESAPIDASGYSEAEQQIAAEVQKLVGDGSISINLTCLQAPVFFSLSQTITLTFGEPVDLAVIAKLIKKSPGIKLINNDKMSPTAVKDANGKDQVFVGRVRQPEQNNHQISLWSVADIGRKGSVLNAVQIVEKLIKSYSE